MGIYFRESGEGPGVVCLHSNASTSSQWRELIDRLSHRFKVLAPDFLGAGLGAPWPDDRDVTLRDESAILEPVFARARDPFHIVGHSYGGAVALIAALTSPERIRSMVLFPRTTARNELARHPQTTEGWRLSVGTAERRRIASPAHDRHS